MTHYLGNRKCIMLFDNDRQQKDMFTHIMRTVYVIIQFIYVYVYVMTFHFVWFCRFMAILSRNVLEKMTFGIRREMYVKFVLGVVKACNLQL